MASDLPPFSIGDLVHLHTLNEGCYDGIGIVVDLPNPYERCYEVYAFDRHRKHCHRIMRYYLMEITPVGGE